LLEAAVLEAGASDDTAELVGSLSGCTEDAGALLEAAACELVAALEAAAEDAGAEDSGVGALAVPPDAEAAVVEDAAALEASPVDTAALWQAERITLAIKARASREQIRCFLFMVISPFVFFKFIIS